MAIIQRVLPLLAMGVFGMLYGVAFGMDSKKEHGFAAREKNVVSPALKIKRNKPSKPEPRKNETYRSINGTGNNLFDNETGAAHTPLVRFVPPDYADGIQDLAGPQRPGARTISNIVHQQTDSIPNKKNASAFLWQWGQFLDHDLDLTDGVDPPEAADIPVPVNDPYFDPNNTGVEVIVFNRSIYDPNSGTSPSNPRQQINEITAWIDASNVYGSDHLRADALRLNDGSGALRTSEGNLLPYNTSGLANAGGSGSHLFLAGDVRANEQIGLTAMHTLFVREHNRLAKKIRKKKPELSGDEIYERARRMVGALMQVITYREFIPAVMGENALAPYPGYRSEIDAGIANIFSTATFRWGHSALNMQLLRLNEQNEEIDLGHLELLDAFFAPQLIPEEGGIEPLLRGLAKQVAQTIDIYIIDDVRNFLFGPPGAGGFDLAALNIQRGRDHGLPSYNRAREAFGLSRMNKFRDISSDPVVRQRLKEAYANVDDIDVSVDGLAEDPLNGALVGELIYTIMKMQFEALRDGDRYWYQRVFSGRQLEDIENTRLSDIIRRNTTIGNEISNDVFHVK